MLTIIAITLVVKVIWDIYSDSVFLNNTKFSDQILDEINDDICDLQYDIEVIKKELQITAFDEEGNVKI